MVTSRDGYVFDDVVLPLKPTLERLAHKLTGRGSCGSLEDDLVQDTMESALRAWPDWTPSVCSVSSSVRGWLCTILANKFMSATRSHYYKTLMTTSWALRSNICTRLARADCDSVQLADIEDFSLETLDVSVCDHNFLRRGGAPGAEKLPVLEGPDSDFGEEVEQALSRIPEDQAVVVRMYYGDEMTTQEIADELGILRSTASTRLMRGIEKIRPMLRYYARESYGIGAQAAFADRDRGPDLRSDKRRNPLRLGRWESATADVQAS